MTDGRRTVRMMLACGLVAVAACGAGSPSVSSAAGQPPPSRPSIPSTVRPTKVLVIVEENHTATSALRGMPYLARAAKSYGRTTAYRAIRHPSLPNYLAIIGGSTFGVTDDRNPSSHHVAGSSVLDQAIARGRTATVYAEGMPTRCALSSHGRYAVRHNPWTYFSDARPRANCRSHDVPAGTPTSGALRTDIRAGRLPNVGLLIPDLCHDAHDCSLANADGWLGSWMAAIQKGPDWRSGRLAVVVTFDEDDRSGGNSNTVLTVVLAPHTRGVVSRAAYSHYSLTRYLGVLATAPPLRGAASARSLRPAFSL